MNEQFNPLTDGPTSQGGPQFGANDTGGWGSKFRGWLNRYGSSVILPIIALLILAGGIYLYARQKTETAALLPEKSAEGISFNEEEIADIAGEATNEEINQEETAPLTAEEDIIQEIISQNGENGEITEKAEKGEGITHLARRAAKKYLADNPKNLSNEHKIFIEDYLKDKIGSRPLEVGEEITFSENLIQEAVNASENLTPEQLKILEQYSALVSW